MRPQVDPGLVRLTAHRHALSADDILVGYQIHAITRGSNHRAVSDAVQSTALIQRHLRRQRESCHSGLQSVLGHCRGWGQRRVFRNLACRPQVHVSPVASIHRHSHTGSRGFATCCARQTGLGQEHNALTCFCNPLR